MKTILNSFLVGSLLTTLALAQQPSDDFGRRGLVNNLERQMAQTATPETHQQWHEPNLMAYVINVAFEFGAVDLRSGGFVQIGRDLPSDVGDGLVQGPGRSLLSLGFDGKLFAIDRFTGETSVVGQTGLVGECSKSSCAPDTANWIGVFKGRYYVTDFANNLYSVDPKTAATKLIGSTGIPAITFVPFNPDPDYPGFVDVFAEGLFEYSGKFYAYFSTQAVNFSTTPVTYTNLILGEIYEVDPGTGHAKAIAPASSNYSAINTVHEKVYAFDPLTGPTGEVDIVDPMTGDATTVTALDPSAGIIAGVTAASPVKRRRCN